jgi:hypothetical protein
MKSAIEILKEKNPRVYYYLLDWKDENFNSNVYPSDLRKPLGEFSNIEIRLLLIIAQSSDKVNINKICSDDTNIKKLNL